MGLDNYFLPGLSGVGAMIGKVNKGFPLSIKAYKKWPTNLKTILLLLKRLWESLVIAGVG
jgi:hypothetical protein